MKSEAMTETFKIIPNTSKGAFSCIHFLTKILSAIKYYFCLKKVLDSVHGKKTHNSNMSLEIIILEDNKFIIFNEMHLSHAIRKGVFKLIYSKNMT